MVCQEAQPVSPKWSAFSSSCTLLSPISLFPYLVSRDKGAIGHRHHRHGLRRHRQQLAQRWEQDSSRRGYCYWPNGLPGLGDSCCSSSPTNARPSWAGVAPRWPLMSGSTTRGGGGGVRAFSWTVGFLVSSHCQHLQWLRKVTSSVTTT